MIRITPAPQGEELFDGCRLSAEGRPVPVHAARVSAMPINTVWPGVQRPLWQTETAGFASIGSDGPATFQADFDRDVGELLVRPLSRNVACARIGPRSWRFTLPGPGQYTCEADGFHNALHLFVDPPGDFACGRSAIRFGPGIHDVGRVELGSDTTVVVDAGAVVRGCFYAYGAENVAVVGHGIIDGSREARPDTQENVYYPCDCQAPIPWDRPGFDAALLRQSGGCGLVDGCLRFYRCRNVRVEGVTLRDSALFALILGQCENAEIANVKTIGMWRYNSDGFDLLNCRNIAIRDSFLRNFDDCVVIKGSCGLDTWNNENILVERCVVWCDWGRSLEIGAETNAPEYSNIVFRDCDLIHGSAVFMDIQHHNRADIHHVLFEDIRAEYTRHQLSEVYEADVSAPYVPPRPVRHPQLCAIPVWDDGLYAKDGLNGRVHDIAFRRIRVFADPGVPTPECFFRGVDAGHDVRDIVLEDFTLNGEPFRPVVHANEFVSGLRLS
jgi:hypothetical protein